MIFVKIEAAQKIEGWMNNEELMWLGTQAHKHKRIVEVGAWMGRTTRVLADNAPDDAHIYAVDTWLGSDEPRHKEILRDKPLSPNAEKPGDNWLLDQWRKYLNPAWFKEPHKVRAQQGTSLAGADYLGRYAVIKFDMIFLDAAHDYDNVKADIIAWKQHLAPGGLLCGHDFGGPFAGVTKAVAELLPTAKKVGAGSIWAA